MITYLLDTLVNSIKTSLINKLGLDPSTEVDLDDFPQLIDDIPILDSVEELTVTENGTYTGTDGVTYNPVNVNLPLGSKSVTANGTYTASDDSLQGYSSVTVDIDDTDLYRDTTDSTYESVKTLSNCGAFPMLSLKVGIEPVQEGSGDPSPTNIRPISGWTEANVSVCGKNIATTEIHKNNYVLASDGTENYASGFIITKEVKIDSSKDYYLSMVGEQSSSSDAIRVGFYDKYLNFISRAERSSPTLLTIPDNAEYIRLSYRNITPYFKDIQIEEGTTATSYEPYNGQTITIDLDGTRYGGTLDVVSGELKVVPYYDSYNGETLEGEWISDRDVYAVGTTPTIGAQVVNIGATPTTYQLTPTQVKSLLGTNNVWADTGDVGDVRYFKKVEL